MINFQVHLYELKTYLGGKIEFKISSVCCKFLESSGCNFLLAPGLGIDPSIGVGELDFKALAFFILIAILF